MINNQYTKKEEVFTKFQSLNNKYYTWKKGDLWLHHNNPTRNNFYDEQHQSEFVVILNEEPSMVKSFNTLIIIMFNRI